jgi:hypothetical protein
MMEILWTVIKNIKVIGIIVLVSYCLAEIIEFQCEFYKEFEREHK